MTQLLPVKSTEKNIIFIIIIITIIIYIYKGN